MLPELKLFAAQIKKERLLAENQLLAAQITEKLIQFSDRKVWVPILSIQAAPKVYLCRFKPDLPETGSIYFAAEWTFSMGWREIKFPLDGDDAFAFCWDEIDALI